MIAIAMDAEEEIDTRLAVGEGCFFKNRENCMGIVREIYDAGKMALVERVFCRFDCASRENVFVPTGNMETVKLNKISYQPTPETIVSGRDKIKFSWSKLEERHRRGVVYQKLEIEQDARFARGTRKHAKQSGQ